MKSSPASDGIEGVGTLNTIEEQHKSQTGTKYRIQIDDYWFSFYDEQVPAELQDTVAFRYKASEKEDVVIHLIPIPDGEGRDEEQQMRRSVALKAAANTIVGGRHEDPAIVDTELVLEKADTYVEWLKGNQ